MAQHLFRDRPGYDLVNALFSRIKGGGGHGRVWICRSDPVDPPTPLKDVASATIALVTEGGLVPPGNPDGLEPSCATSVGRYSLEGVDDLTGEHFESIHAGFDHTAANEDPDRLVPLDALRALEREGVVGRLHPTLYSTSGHEGYLYVFRHLGRLIAEEMNGVGVEGAIVTATTGTGTRSGAAMTKELERAGICTVLITVFPLVAMVIGTNRIVRGEGMAYPVGDPGLPPHEERALRLRLARRALRALACPVEGPTVFQGEAQAEGESRPEGKE